MTDSRHAGSNVWRGHCIFNSDKRHVHYERNLHAHLGYQYNVGSVLLQIWKNISQQSLNCSEYEWLVFGTLLEHFDFTTSSIICLLFYTGLRAVVNTVLNSGFYTSRKISRWVLLHGRDEYARKTLSLSLLSPEMRYVWEHSTVVNIWCKRSGTDKTTSTRK